MTCRASLVRGATTTGHLRLTVLAETSAPPEVSVLRSELVAATAVNQDSAKEESDPKALLDLLDGMTEHGALFMKPSGETEKERPI